MVSKMKSFLKFKTSDSGHDARKFGEEFYLREARIWRPFRWVGMLSTILALVLSVASIFNKYWLHGTAAGTLPTIQSPVVTQVITQGVSRDFESSIWDCACAQIDASVRPPECIDKIHGWQKGVIGLIIFSASVGFGAAILAICGVCTSPLPKKIYYFHSAGEIFFVCALSSTIALIIYAVAMSTDSTFASYSFGSGFGLGWAGTAFFYAAAFCMSLDELVRESAQNRCCRYIFWRSRTSEPENTHPV